MQASQFSEEQGIHLLHRAERDLAVDALKAWLAKQSRPWRPAVR
jgi:hypothetical protein